MSARARITVSEMCQATAWVHNETGLRPLYFTGTWAECLAWLSELFEVTDAEIHPRGRYDS